MHILSIKQQHNYLIIYKAIKRVGNAESGSKQSKDAEPGSKQSKAQKKLNKPGRSQVVFYVINYIEQGTI